MRLIPDFILPSRRAEQSIDSGAASQTLLADPSGALERIVADRLHPGLPPGPALPAVVQTLLYLLRPTSFLGWCHERYGDLFTLDTILFGVEVVVCHPEDVRRVFTGDPDVLRAGEANTLLEALVGKRSVLLLDGAEHLRQRRLLMPPFHGERMVAYARTMQETTERVIAGWPRGEVMPLHPSMQQITLEIILRTIFGAEEAGELGELREALAGLLDRISTGLSSLFLAPSLRFDLLGLSPWERYKRDRAYTDGLIYRKIAKRRTELLRGERRDDVLSMLICARDEDGQPLTDEELRDELMTLLVAGHETTATMLCWAFELVLADPRVLERLLAELDGVTREDGVPSPAELAKIPYLDAVIKEVLRLRPVIPAVGRVLKEPMELRGRRLPEGTLLAPSIYLVHHRADLYPEPHAFRPERFLEKKADPYAFFPFGGGIRRCLGMAFALFEMKIVLGTIFSRLTLAKARAEPAAVRVRTFTLAPDRGVLVRIAERCVASAQ